MDKAKVMAILDLTEEEFDELQKADEAIDKGADLFPLDAEQKKVEKKMRQADRAVNAYGKKVERVRKSDNDKADLINALFSAILPMCEQYEITNAEREFTFTYHGRKFKVVLSAPRS